MAERILQVRLSQNTKDYLQGIAKEDGVTVSWVVRDALLFYIGWREGQGKAQEEGRKEGDGNGRKQQKRRKAEPVDRTLG